MTITGSFPPTLSTNHLVQNLNYDTSAILSEDLTNFNLTTSSNIKQTPNEAIKLLQGKRDEAPAFLNLTY